MSHSAILLVAVAILAHLVADFVLQTDAIAEAKAATDGRAWRGLAMHTAIVAACLLPFVAAYGTRGLGYLLIVSLAHGLIDRSKIVLHRRAVARAAPAYPDAGSSRGRSGRPGVAANRRGTARGRVAGRTW